MESENGKKRSRGRPSAKKQMDIEHVLEIAIKSFANKGFDGTQMKAIADEAGFAKSLMNYHFGSKENLWKQAVSHLGAKLMKRFMEVQGYFKDLEGLAAMKAYTRQFIYFSAEYPEFYKLVFHEMCTRTERAAWLVETILAPAHYLYHGKKPEDEEGKQLFHGYPVANLSSIIIGVANVFFINAFQMEQMYGIDPFDQKEIELHADIVIDLLFAKFQE